MAPETLGVLSSKHHTLGLARSPKGSMSWVYLGPVGRSALTPRAFVWALEVPWPELENTVSTFLAEHEMEELFDKLPIEGTLIEGLRMSDYWGKLACQWLSEMPTARFSPLVMIALQGAMTRGASQSLRHAARRLVFRNGGNSK